MDPVSAALPQNHQRIFTATLESSFDWSRISCSRVNNIWQSSNNNDHNWAGTDWGVFLLVTRQELQTQYNSDLIIASRPRAIEFWALI